MCTEKQNDAEADNRRLVELYTEIAVLAGGLAHEIKNPLSTIRLNLQLLAEDFTDAKSSRDKRALQKIQTLESSCQRLQDILDDFLRFSRIGVESLPLAACDLNVVVQEMIDFTLAQAAELGIELVSYLDPNLPAVELDRELFNQALLNLVLNAQNAMPAGGQIVLQTQREGDRARLDVIDNGVGMDADTQAKIFRPFFSTRGEGSGLGLPTTRKIIEAHDGTISVQSERGKGTRFTILLPVVAEPARAAPTPAAS